MYALPRHGKTSKNTRRNLRDRPHPPNRNGGRGDVRCGHHCHSCEDIPMKTIILKSTRIEIVGESTPPKEENLSYYLKNPKNHIRKVSWETFIKELLKYK